MTRRELLSGAFAAGALYGKARRVDRSRISAITDEIARSPGDAIAFLKQYGLRWCELRSVPGGRASYDAMDAAALAPEARRLRDNGIRVSFLDAGLFKHSLPDAEPVRRRAEPAEARARRLKADGERFERRMEYLDHAIRAARILGADKVRVFTFSRVEDPRKLLQRIAQILEPMAALARKNKVRLLVENEASCNVATCAELAALMELMPSPAIGINWDSLNGASFGEKPFPDGYRLLPKDRLHNIQIKGRSVLDYPQKLDWRAIFDATAGDGYKDCFGLETHIFGDGQIAASHASMKEILRILETA